MTETEKPDLGTAIDMLYQLRTERLAVEKTVKEMKSKELELRVYIKGLLDAASLEGGRGQTASTSIIHSVEPTVKDWAAFYAYVKENDCFDMLQRRVSATAVKDRWEAGVVIPGVDKFDTWDLSLTKRSK